ITAIGFTSGNGIQISTETSTQIMNNTIRTGVLGTSSNIGINIVSADYVVVRGNVVVTNGTSTNHGMVLTGSDNITIVNNSVIARGSATSNHGIYITSTISNDNVIVDNVLVTNGTSSNNGILIDAAQSFNNTIANNTIRTFGTSSDNFGIRLQSAARTLVIANDIATNGTLANHAIVLISAANSTFENNVINTSGVGSYGIHITTSNTTLFSNNTLFNTVEWIFMPASANVNNTFVNNTFVGLNSSVKFNETSVADGRFNVTHEKLNLGHIGVLLNGTNVSF
ncbi:MAG: right-handed parallel beta-helix repeat-containing protein, partial [Nanoarchaeota archaeon]